MSHTFGSNDNYNLIWQKKYEKICRLSLPFTHTIFISIEIVLNDIFVCAYIEEKYRKMYIMLV